MTQTLKPLAQVEPGTTLVDVYTVPSGATALVRTIRIHNTTTSDKTISIHHALNGAATATKQKLYDEVTVNAKEIMVDDGRIIMSAGDVLRMSASASGVSVNVYGSVLTP